MNKTLLKSVREYKKQSILAPILVILEVLMEVLIPMEMANIIDIGMTSGDLHYIIQRGVILVVMAMSVSYTHLYIIQPVIKVATEGIPKEFRTCLGLNYLRGNSVGTVISVIHVRETARVRGGPLTCW